MKKIYNSPKISIAKINGESVCLDPSVHKTSVGTTLDDLSKDRGQFTEEDLSNDDFWN